MRRRIRGFTIVEILVALAIVAVLAAIAVPAYRGYQERARTRQAMAGIRALEAQIDAFELEHRAYPPDLAALGLDGEADPWGRPYEYLRIEGEPPAILGQVRKDKNLIPLNTDYDLYSRGTDGATQQVLTAEPSRDDIVRANDGGFLGLATEY